MSDLMQIIAKSRPAAQAAGRDSAFSQAASASRANTHYAANQSHHASPHRAAQNEGRQNLGNDRDNFADMMQNDRIQHAREQDSHAKSERIQAARTQDARAHNARIQNARTQNENGQEAAIRPERPAASQQDTVRDTSKIDPAQRPAITQETREKIGNALQDFSKALEQGDPDAIEKTGQDLLALLAGFEGETKLGAQISDLVQRVMQSGAMPAQQSTPVSTVLATIADMLAKIDGEKNAKPNSPVLAAIASQQSGTDSQAQASSTIAPTTEATKTAQVLAPAELAKVTEAAAKSDPLLAKAAGLTSGLATQSLRDSAAQNTPRDTAQVTQPTNQAGTKAQDPQTLLANLADRLSAASNQAPATNTSASQLAAALPATAAATTIVTASPDGALVQIELSANGSQTQVGTASAPARSFAGNLPGQLNLPNLAFEMSRQFTNGNSRFEIRLDPPEMGRIDVRMEIDASGTVTARLSVEKAETLDYLQRDARALERALEEAGLKGGEANLEFTLKSQNQGTEAEDNDWLNFAENDDSETDTTDVIAAQMTHYSGIARPGGLNLLA